MYDCVCIEGCRGTCRNHGAKGKVNDHETETGVM